MKELSEIQDKVNDLIILGIKPSILLVDYNMYRDILHHLIQYYGNSNNGIGMKDIESTKITLNFTGASLQVFRSAQMKPNSFEVLGNEKYKY